jgi:nitroreductase
VIKLELEEIIYKRRTIRRFKQDPIPLDLLKKLIDYARVAPAARNIQALEFIIIQNTEIRERLFPLVKWSSSLPEEQRTPEKGREPTADIVVLINNKIKRAYVDFDVGASVENILLGAVNFGIGCCWMGAIDREGIRELLEIPENYEIPHVISLGYPDEDSTIEPYKNSFDYWKDNEGNMHVPKRDLNDIIFKIY